MGLDDHVNDCISMFILGMCMIPCLPIWYNLVLGTGLCSIWVISTHDSSFCSNRSYMHIEFACSHFRSMNTCFLWFSQCRWVMHMVLDMLTLAQAQFCVSLCNQPWLFWRHKHTGHIDVLFPTAFALCSSAAYQVFCLLTLCRHIFTLPSCAPVIFICTCS